MEKESVLTAKNGIKIYSYKNPALHGFYISLFVRAGMLYEEESEKGITHFLEHAVIRNINKLYENKLYSELDKRGLEFNASTFSEMVQFYISGSNEEFGFGGEVIGRVLDSFALTAEEIDKERKRIKAEIRESDEKSSLASFSSKIVFEGTRLSGSIMGTNKTVDGITLLKLDKYRKKIFTSENVFLYLTGNFTAPDVDRLLNVIGSKNVLSAAARDNVAEVPQAFGKRELDIHIKNSDYAMARFAFDIDMSKFSVAEIDLLYDILLSGYNSRLFVELSEKRGLCYDISGGTERYKNIGTFHFSFEMKERDIYDAVKISVDILLQMKNKVLLAEECMKAGYVKNAYMLYDDARELNFTFAYDNHIMGEKYSNIEDRINRYKNITPQRIREVADAVFSLNNLTFTMKGNKKKIDKDILFEELKRMS